MIPASDTQFEVERLSFAVLRGAYVDLANVLKLYKPGIQFTVLQNLEENVLAAIKGLAADRVQGALRADVVVGIGEKLNAVFDEARAPIPVELDALDDRVVARS